MTDDLHIRPATPDDTESIAELYRDAYETAADLGFPSRMLDITSAELREWISDENSNLWVGLCDGEPVAAVRMLEERAHPYGERLAVHPDARGEGTGTHLREFVEARAREKGYEKLQIATFGGHPFLVEHYLAEGYEVFDRWESDSRPYDVLGLEKRL